MTNPATEAIGLATGEHESTDKHESTGEPIVLERADVRVMLWHVALYGLAAIVADSGADDVRLSWTSGMQPRGLIWAGGLDRAAGVDRAAAVDQAAGIDRARVGEIVWAHAQRHSAEPSWVRRDVVLKGTARGLMSPRITPFENADVRRQVQRQRHRVLDALTRERAWLDLRLLGALGEPCYWSRNDKGEPLQDDGASRLEMQPRNQGSEFVGSRLRKLAETVAARDPQEIIDGLVGRSVRDEAGGEGLASRSATGFANPGPTDNAVAWCALWGISQLPLAPRVDATAVTSGHIGRTRREWFHLPVWEGPWRPARLRSVLVSRQLRTAASAGLPARWAAPDADVLAANAWLAARGVLGVIRFPIERFGSDSAPERRAMLGQPLRVGLGRRTT